MVDDGTTKGRGSSAAPQSSSGADQERIAAYLSGSQAAFSELDGWISREIAARYPILRPEIEDLCQAVHAKLVTNLRTGLFQGRSTLRTYVTGVAHHTAVDRIRKTYRDRAVFVQEAEPADPVAPDNPYRSLQKAEDGRLLYEALQRSPEACRELWRLVFLEKLSYDMIASRLVVPAGTVKSRMWYCRRKMMDLLARMRGRRERP